ncbi:MAG: hypothetical protein ACYDCW_13970 [Acidithiobacillus ferrivorans]
MGAKVMTAAARLREDFSLDVDYQRYLDDRRLKHLDAGPDGAFRPPDKSDQPTLINAEYNAMDCVDAESLTIHIHAPRLALLRQFALCGFGAPLGVFPGIEKLAGVLAERVLSSWLAAASQYARLEDFDLDAQFSYQWHLSIQAADTVVHGPASRHELVDPVAGLTEDGLPVLRDGAPLNADGSKDYKNPAWKAQNRVMLHARRKSGPTLPGTHENAVQRNSVASNVRALRDAYREALTPSSRLGGSVAPSGSGIDLSNGNSLTVTPSHSGTNCSEFGL